MLWLYLLAAVTVLVIALRRVLHRLKPLDDQLYSSRVAIDHVHSGVAWVRADGTIGSMNLAFAAILGIKRGDLDGRDWMLLFPQRERGKIRELHRQLLLTGIAAMDTCVERANGSVAWLNMVLVAVHDHKTRFIGHHCLTADRTHERQLEQRIAELSAAAEREPTTDSTPVRASL
jgi:PAS domain S-box-containing protein